MDEITRLGYISENRARVKIIIRRDGLTYPIFMQYCYILQLNSNGIPQHRILTTLTCLCTYDSSVRIVLPIYICMLH